MTYWLLSLTKNFCFLCPELNLLCSTLLQCALQVNNYSSINRYDIHLTQWWKKHWDPLLYHGTTV